jgi:uncharacterized protein (TIGR00299 family) protein
MKLAYFDCASGISGDMTLGALVDLGVPLEKLQKGIDSLGLPSCRLEVEEVHRKGFRASKVHVRHEPEHAHRHLHHITEMITASTLAADEQDLAIRIFTRLGEAEAHVHGTTIRKVHFHEVGAVDSIADIVGAAIGWTHLKVDRFVCSPVPTGTGTIMIAHGKTSVPAPATAELLKGIPLAASEVPAELTTPTGAAILKTLCTEFGPVPAMTIDAIGYGAGDKDFESHGNILRVLIGTAATPETGDQILVLETNLDDTTGEVIGHCTERLLAAGALDVYTTAIHMKKNRPATKLTILCEAPSRQALEAIVFQETSTLGIRRQTADRSTLPREATVVETEWGPVHGKIATLPHGERRFSPEYEACRQIAQQHDIAVTSVQAAACTSYVANKPPA